MRRAGECARSAVPLALLLALVLAPENPANAFGPPLRPSVAALPATAPDARATIQNPVAARFDMPMRLYVRERALDAVFDDIARTAGFRVRVNDRLGNAMVSRRPLAGSLRDVLELLARENNLVWFAERELIDVSRADTATVQAFQIGTLTDAQIREAMARFGIVNADNALEVDERNGVARIFGPPRLASRIESIIVALRPAGPTAGPVEIIRYGQRVTE